MKSPLFLVQRKSSAESIVSWGWRGNNEEEWMMHRSSEGDNATLSPSAGHCYVFLFAILSSGVHLSSVWTPNFYFHLFVSSKSPSPLLDWNCASEKKHFDQKHAPICSCLIPGPVKVINHSLLASCCDTHWHMEGLIIDSHRVLDVTCWGICTWCHSQSVEFTQIRCKDHLACPPG